MPSYLVHEHKAGDDLLLQLGRALWSWSTCSRCDNSSASLCYDLNCVKSRVPQLRRYSQFYKDVVKTYVSESDDQLIISRESLFAVLSTVKANPTVSLSRLGQLSFPGGTPTASSARAQCKAVYFAIKILFMVDSSPLHHYSDRLEQGTYRKAWIDDVPLNEYLQDIFPTTNHSILNNAGSNFFEETKEQLKAVNLVRDLGITFRATSDVQNHLRLDRRHKVLEVYHFTSFLKEQLRATRDERGSLDFAAAVRKGSLPRQLVLEVLDSIHSILFPLTHKESSKLLKHLVLTQGFDEDIRRVEISLVRRVGEESVAFFYLADRLSELHAELQNPRPRGRLGQVMERWSGSRYIMLATLIGVIFAILLGIASLGLSAFQAYVAYQAWKHPVSPSEG